MGRQQIERETQPEGAVGGMTDMDCRHEGQRLPFDTSFTWDAPVRHATEDRLTRLVKTLEDEIIPRLVQAHRAVAADAELPRVAGRIPSAADVNSFVKLALGRDGEPMFAHVHSLHGRGVSIETIYLDLLAPTAQRLGEMWEEDSADFTEVTVGVGRLQQVLRELSPAFGMEVEHPLEGRRALLVPAPGEQHTFGLSMVSEFFRRAGWEVAGGVGGSRTNAAEMVQREWFDMIGFSVGSETRLDWLRTGISAVRELSRNRSIAVLVGGPIFKLHPEYVAQVGADATAADGLQAPVVAENLVAHRVRRG